MSAVKLLSPPSHAKLRRIMFGIVPVVLGIQPASAQPLLTQAANIDFVDIEDEPVEYEYDKNGNMTKDLNRDIAEIKYNLLNLGLRPNLGCISGMKGNKRLFSFAFRSIFTKFADTDTISKR